jgi:DNA-binding transcriptional LysR family regulator
MAAPGLSAEPLFQVPNAFIAKPGVFPTRRITPLAALVELPLITFARRTEPYVQLLGVLRDARLVHKARVHASASVATIARMALDGLGVALLPPVTVTDALQSGELVEIKTDVVLPKMSFEVAWHTASDPDFVRILVDLAHQAASSFTHPRKRATGVAPRRPSDQHRR